MSPLFEILRRKQEAALVRDRFALRPRTLSDPDRDTFWCDVVNARFTYYGAKIVEMYVNGDALVRTLNGVTFTARASEIMNLRRGDYHESVSSAL